MAILLASITWLAFHYFTGAVRIAMIRQRRMAEQGLLFVEGRDTWKTRFYIHAAPVFIAYFTRNVIQVDRILWLAAKMVFFWWLFWRFWTWLLA